MQIGDLVEQVRYHINDQKFLASTIVNELPGDGKATAHAAVNKWNSFATGVNHEEFLTKNMPLVSGAKAVLRGGRWAYDFVGQFPNNYGVHTGRQFLIDYYRGLFLIPSGATPVVSGAKMALTYSFWEDREYRFNDDEVKSWMIDGESYLRERMTLPYQTIGRGSGLTFNPVVPSGLHFSLLALTTSYFMRRRLQEEGIQEGVYVREGETVFDSTKTLVHRGKQLDEVKKDIDAIIMDVRMGELASAGVRIDSYSTLDFNDVSAYSMEINTPSAKPWI